MPDLKLGILLWSQCAPWPEMLAAAQRIDRLGYDSLWTWDHVHAIFGDPQQPIFEGWGLLNAWAMATQRVKLGLMVGANTFRNPGLVAKSAATLDHVSGGRAILGLGGAWFEYEHAPPRDRLRLGRRGAAGLARRVGRGVPRPARRRDRHLPARAAITASTTSATTRRPSRRDCPIMIGGNGRKKTLRTVAKYADMWNGFGTARRGCRARRRPARPLRRRRPRRARDRADDQPLAGHPGFGGGGPPCLGRGDGPQRDDGGGDARSRRGRCSARRSGSRSGSASTSPPASPRRSSRSRPPTTSRPWSGSSARSSRSSIGHSRPGR